MGGNAAGSAGAGKALLRTQDNRSVHSNLWMRTAAVKTAAVRFGAVRNRRGRITGAAWAAPVILPSGGLSGCTG